MSVMAEFFEGMFFRFCPEWDMGGYRFTIEKIDNGMATIIKHSVSIYTGEYEDTELSRPIERDAHGNEIIKVDPFVLRAEDFGDDEDDYYTPSATHGDYSPSCPWNAPGMSISDFI